MEITNTDLGTVVGVPVVLLLSCIILAIMFYCRCYIPAQRKKTLERAHVTYIADPTSRPGKTISSSLSISNINIKVET